MAWPLVGREHELAALGDATANPGAGALLVGEAGVGKTRLARAVLDAAYASGCRTEWVAGAVGAAGVPLGALAHLVSGFDDIGTDTSSMFRGAARALTAPSYGRLVLGVDDAHLLDEASAAVLQNAVVSEQASMVATLRRGHALPASIDTLVRDGVLTRVELVPLSDDEVDQLLTAMLEHDVDADTRRQLGAACRGNPMVLRELVQGGLDTGALAELDGVWSWRGPLSAPRLVELVEARCSRLTAEQRDALEVLAVGEPLSVDVMERISGVETIEALDRAGLLDVRSDQGGNMVLRLAHPLYGDVLRVGASPLRVRTIKRRLADSLTARADLDSGELLRAVCWRLDAGDDVEQAYLIRAARRAFVGFDFVLAERLARAAVDSGATGEAASLLGIAIAGQGRIDEAHDVLSAVESGSDDDVTALLTRAVDLFFYGSRTTSAAAAVRRVERALATRREWPADSAPLVEAARAGVLLVGGSVAEARRVARSVLDDPLASHVARLRALLVAAPAAAMAACTTEAFAHAEQGLALIEAGAGESQPATDELVDVGASLLLAGIQSVAHRVAGRLDLSERVARQGYDSTVGDDARSERGLWAFALGQVMLARGKPRTAIRFLREADTLLRGEQPIYLVWCLANLAEAHALLHEVDAARDVVDDADEQRSAGIELFDCDLRRARAWMLAADGNADAARTLALSTCDGALTNGQAGLAAIAAHDAARLGAAHEAVGRLDTIARVTDTDLIPAFAAHAHAIVESDISALEDTAAAFADLGATLVAAEAYAEAACLHRERGQRGPARSNTARAARLAQECEGAVTNPLLTLDRPPELSNREFEIARLAMQGLTNRAIADRLHVSTRTVDNHLHRVYTKLGATGRADLPGLLPDDPRPDPPR